MIVRCTSDSSMTFDKFVANKGLMELLHSTYEGDFFDKGYPRVESEEGNFYGEIVDGMPWGLGLVKTEKELFYGTF